MDLKRYIAPLLKWWWLVIVAAALAGGVAFYVTRQQPKLFQARTTLMIGNAIFDPNPNLYEFDATQQLARVYADLVKREPIRVATMAALSMEFLPDYASRPLANGLVEITVIHTNPELAQAVCSELANQLILQSPTNPKPEEQQRQVFVQTQLNYLQDKIKETQADLEQRQQELSDMVSAQQIASAQQEIEALSSKLASLQGNYASLLATTSQNAINTLAVFEPAALPTEPIRSNAMLIIALAVASGAALAVGAAYVIELLDNTFKNADEVSQAVPYPIVGHIGELERERGGALLSVAERPLGPVAEGFRSLRTNLEFVGVDRPLKTIVITSANAGDGKSSVALNLAIMMAQSDKRVVLLDSDLRRPSLHRVLGIPNREGLSDLFRGHLTLDDVTRSGKVPRLQVITSGTVPPNPTELLSSNRMDQILDELKGVADVVIVDSPPFFVADAWVLASKVDGVLFVVRPGYTRRNMVRAAIEQFKRVNARVIGVALNRLSRPRGLYTPGAYMSYYYSVEVDQQTGAASGGVKPRGLQGMLRGLQRRAEKPALPSGASEPAAEPAPANGNGHTVRLDVLPPAAPVLPINERSRVSLDVLYAISRELATQLDLKELMQRVLQMTLDSFGASSGSIIVLDDRGEAMEGVMIYEGRVQTQDSEQLADVIDRGLAGWVIKHRRPAVLDDTHADERWVRRGWDADGSGPRSVVSVPLLASDRVVGVLTLAHSSVGHFSRDDLSMLTAIAVGLSTNSRAYAN
jgi:capsular exopolysaccharide synthesis family protein